jgi:hypothetical protein
MLKKPASIVLSRSSPCNVPQGYVSVAELPAALLDGLFEHPARDYPIVLEWGPLNFYRIHDGRETMALRATSARSEAREKSETSQAV